MERPILTSISQSDSLANARTLVITTASLIGGPIVGAMVGLVGGFIDSFKEIFQEPFILSVPPLVGYISGYIGDKWKTEVLYPSRTQVIAISILVECIQMLFVGIFTSWQMVERIFLPMILLNSLGSTIFLEILKTYLSHERQLRAVQTKDVMDLTQQPRWGLDLLVPQSCYHRLFCPTL
ncbi:LytS/YhcK type 5TM receptor domain-containing protein [Streptococcus suis]|nr:LytS/YhcK type 5TM receptor domain-containing protein [Streptococcus suis]